MQGYKMIYSEGNLNKADGVVIYVYVRNDITESAKIVIVDKLNVSNACIKISNGGRTVHVSQTAKN